MCFTARPDINEIENGALTTALSTLAQSITTLQAEVDALKNRWSINTTLTSGGWFCVGIIKSIASGEFSIRSDHNLVNFRLSRLYNVIEASKLTDVNYAGTHESFSSVRVRQHPTSMYASWLVEILIPLMSQRPRSSVPSGQI